MGVVAGFIVFFITYSFDDDEEEEEELLATPSEWSGPMCREREKRRHCLKPPSRNDEYPNDMSFLDVNQKFLELI